MSLQSDSSVSASQGYQLQDDIALLNLMIQDSAQQPALYNPGPYWAAKAKGAVAEIQRFGLSDFRGSSNLIGLSYSDNLFIDVRGLFKHGYWRFLRSTLGKFPLKRIFEAQLRWTESYANQSIAYAQEILRLHPKIPQLLARYKVPYSLLGNCLCKANVQGKEYATHYLNLLEQHDNIASRIQFKKARSLFEIGGGFGANVHLLLENYPNIRKVLYLDIPPNLYVGTQYLRSFFGDAVHDYRALKGRATLQFSANDDREILCIAPWQIEQFSSPIDIFMNSHSFVEMPRTVVENYARKVMGFPDASNTAIALTTYDGYDLSNTVDPNELPKCFNGRNFDHFEVATLLQSTRQNLYYVSAGKLA